MIPVETHLMKCSRQVCVCRFLHERGVRDVFQGDKVIAFFLLFIFFNFFYTLFYTCLRGRRTVPVFIQTSSPRGATADAEIVGREPRAGLHVFKRQTEMVNGTSISFIVFFIK